MLHTLFTVCITDQPHSSRSDVRLTHACPIIDVFTSSSWKLDLNAGAEGVSSPCS